MTILKHPLDPMGDFRQKIIDQLYKMPFAHEEHRQWVQMFLGQALNSNKSTHTLVNYRADLAKFLLWFEKFYERPVSSADVQSISAYQAYLRGRHQELRPPPRKNLWKKFINLFKGTQGSEKLYLNPFITPLAIGSQKRHLSTLKNFFEFLKESHEGMAGKKGNLFQHNPVRTRLHSVRLKDADVEHTVAVSEKEWELLDRWATRPMDRAALFLLYFGGLRLAEVCRLRFQNLLDAEGGVEIIRKGGLRHQFIFRRCDLVFTEIGRYKEQLSRLGMEIGPETPLFPGRRGGPMSERALSERIKKVLLKAGCRPELSAHSFRKACATEMYRETRDLLAVRDYLNHADAKVTQTYIDTFVLES